MVGGAERVTAPAVIRVLGIDPGLRITGYGCVEMRGEALMLVEAGVIRLTMEAAGARVPVADRLLELHADLSEAIERLKPGTVAVEAVFAHYKHPATAIAMGHARGVILLAARKAGLPIVELKPNAPVAPDTFKFTPPKGADVIEDAPSKR